MEIFGSCTKEGYNFSNLYDYLRSHMILEKDEIEEIKKLALQYYSIIN